MTTAAKSVYVLDACALLPIEIVAFTNDIFWHAVQLMAAYPMSYADCFAD